MLSTYPRSFLVFAAGLFTALVGVAVLAGWQFDIALLKNPFEGTVSMKANTAGTFLIAGLALMFLQSSHHLAGWLVRLLAVVAMFVGFFSFMQDIFGWNIGLATMLYPEPEGTIGTSQPGLMATNTAINFFLLGSAFFMLTLRRFRDSFLIEFPVVFSLSISVLGLAGYLTGFQEVTGLVAHARMAIHTAATFIILSLGVLLTVYGRRSASATIQHKLFGGLTAAAAVIIFITFLSSSGIESLIRTSAWVEQTHQAKNRITGLFAHVLELQSDERGFLLSNDDTFHAATKSTSRTLPAFVDSLRSLTADNTRQHELLVSLERLVLKRIACSEGLVSMQRTEEVTRGQMITDSIRVVIAQMLAEEDRLLETRNRDGSHQANRTQSIIYLGLVMQALLLGIIFVVVDRDVAGRRKAEDSLRRKSEELDRYFLHTPDLLCIVDLDGNFRRLNKAWESTLGYRLEELEGRSILSFVHPEDLGATSEALAGFPKDSEALNFTNRYRHKDGTYRWIEWRYFPGGPLINASARDITKRKQAEEALKESDKRYQNLFDSIDEGFCIIEMMFDEQERPTDYRFLEINPSFERQTGLHDALGKRMRELAPLHEQHWFDIYGHIAMTGEANRFQNRAEQLNRWYDVYAFRFGEPKNRQVAILFNDISARMAAESRIVQLNGELQQQVTAREAANKELEAFSYSVSHDLRAPLRSIDGFSQALLKDYNERLDDKGRDFLHRVRAASQRMAALIDDMLQLSRITRTEMRRKKVDLSMIAREIAAELQKTEPARRAEFIIADGLIGDGDPQLLRVGMENLLGNSWKYTGKNPSPRIEFGAMQRDGRTVYYVRDNGAGFDMAYVNKLFGAFQRLHSTADFEGTGIGLATVQRIINRHNGRVWAEGKINEGATFYFSL